MADDAVMVLVRCPFVVLIPVIVAATVRFEFAIVLVCLFDGLVKMGSASTRTDKLLAYFNRAGIRAEKFVI